MTLDGINFQRCAFVRALVDGVDLLEEPFFRDGVIVFEELERSRLSSGNYLIFTCACGVADDGGWHLVKVQHNDGVVKWSVSRGSDLYECSFAVKQYQTAVENLKSIVSNLDPRICLEPTSIFFPE